MKLESWIQIISLVVVVILAIFYNPTKAELEGKILFASVILAVVLFLIFFDLYKKVEDLEKNLKLFDEKFKIHNRLRDLEELKTAQRKK